MRRLNLAISALLVALALSVSGPVFGATCYVPDSYPTIQSALNAAASGDTVIVRDGTYTGVGNKELDFKGKQLTLRSENGPDTCIVDCEGSGTGIYLHSGETSSSVVDGFTIMNGVARGTSKYFRRGGGIRLDNSSPTITNCIIKRNSAESYGGGLYCHASTGNPSSPIITNCTFSENSAEIGGGIWVYNSSPIIINCAINGNSAILMVPSKICQRTVSRGEERNPEKASCIEEMSFQSPAGDKVAAIGDKIDNHRIVLTDIEGNRVAIDTLHGKHLNVKQTLRGWTILKTVEDGTLAVRCGH